ncbi:MAG: cytochrome b/b6 domain-containing protein [Gammaproteobacteria bacterium]
MAEERRLVWDLPVRLFHWLLVLSMIGSYVSAKTDFEVMGLANLQVHMYLGYWTIGLIIFRILWGFVGPKHARFSSFLKGPSGIWRYARALGAGTMIETAGHNPLGGLSVILLLALVAFQAGTGLFTTDEIVWNGPYYGAVSESLGLRLSAWHQMNFNFILAAVALHLMAIAFYFIVKKQNLVGSMVHGRKYVAESEAITRSEIVKAIIVIVIAAGLVYWLLAAAPVGDASFE